MKPLKEMKIDIKNVWMGFLAILLTLFVGSYIMDLFNLDIPFLLLNFIFVMFIFCVLRAVTGRNLPALTVSLLIIFTIKYIDTCIFSARLTHLRLSDFTAIRQAIRVASNYEFIWGGKQWQQLGAIGLAGMLFGLLQRALTAENNTRQNRIFSISGMLILFILLIEGTLFNLLPIPENAAGFDANAVVNKAGLFGTWYAQTVKSRMKKPDGYSKSKAKTILDQYDGAAGSSDENVNIIVIMNESFTDYSLVGIPEFEDPIPGIHEMVENGELFEGKLAASVLGGGTCNTEWEFLTGNSLINIPDGAYAFTTYVKQDINSIARDLSPLGYRSTFFHPYYSQEWNRQSVYSFMGFDNFVAGDTLEGGLQNKEIAGEHITESLFERNQDDVLVFGQNLEYLRTLISDGQAYKLFPNMITLDDGKADDFLFCVTIQNHGGYTYTGGNFTNIEYIREKGDTNHYLQKSLAGGYSSRPESINQYLTLTNYSDQAFCDYIKSLESVSEKTIVVMFGDHQPGLRMDDYITYDDSMHLKNEEQSHIIPYLVWSNFDIDYDFPEYISANYLSAIIKDSIGLPLTSWDQMRLKLMKKYPVMTTNFILDDNYELSGDSTNELRNYEIVQYMRMFD